MTHREWLPAVKFIVPAEGTQRVRDWIAQCDRTVIAYRLREFGKALVLVMGPSDGPRMFTIREMPQSPDIVPYYGTIHAMYKYAISPGKGGFYMCVHHLGEDAPPAIGYPDGFPPFETYVASPPVFDLQTNGYHKPGLHIEEDISEELTFGIPAVLIPKLQKFGWTRDRLSEYRYDFIPTSIGTMIAVAERDGGRRIDLTEDVDW